MKKIAFATAAHKPELCEEDSLVASFSPAGFIEPVIWTDENIDWQNYQAVIVRTCWDYHYKPQEFLDWMDKLESAGVPLLNPPDVMFWNMDKSVYLPEINAAGIDIPPTLWFDTLDAERLLRHLSARGWSKAVVKPSISAGADNTWVVTPKSNPEQLEQQLQKLPNYATIMVQQYLPQIETHGEWALIYFNGEFSHAALKKAKQGDYRIQEEHGGHFFAAQPPAAVRELADKANQYVIDKWGKLLYNRVDIIEAEPKPVVIEVELIEPALYMTTDVEAAKKFAAILQSHELIARN